MGPRSTHSNYKTAHARLLGAWGRSAIFYKWSSQGQVRSLCLAARGGIHCLHTLLLWIASFKNGVWYTRCVSENLTELSQFLPACVVWDDVRWRQNHGDDIVRLALQDEERNEETCAVTRIMNSNSIIEIFLPITNFQKKKNTKSEWFEPGYQLQ